jgi:hypothetical protein
MKVADQLQPDDPEIHSNLAAAYAAIGDTKAAFRNQECCGSGTGRILSESCWKQL